MHYESAQSLCRQLTAPLNVSKFFMVELYALFGIAATDQPELVSTFHKRPGGDEGTYA